MGPRIARDSWDAVAFDPKGFRAFRALPSRTKHLVVSTNVKKPFERDLSDRLVTFSPLSPLGAAMKTS